MNLMTPEKFVSMAQYAAYHENMSSFDMMDCWGLVELWHKHIFNIDLDDRNLLLCNATAITEGRASAKKWDRIFAPRDHSVALLKSNYNRTPFKYGHCGVIYKSKLYHIERNHDFHCQDVRDRRISSRITEIRIHRELA